MKLKCSNPKCKKPWKDEEEFGKNSSTPTGRQYYCKICKKEADRISKQKHKIKNAIKDKQSVVLFFININGKKVNRREIITIY